MPAIAAREVLLAGAALLAVIGGAELLAGAVATQDGWSYAAAALGCVHAGVLGAATVAAGRRTMAAAWAPALLWPLAGPAPAAAAVAALAGALLLATRLRTRGRALAGALAAGALAILVGAATAAPPEAAVARPAAQIRAADAAPGASLAADRDADAGAREGDTDAGEHDAGASEPGDSKQRDTEPGGAEPGDGDASHAEPGGADPGDGKTGDNEAGDTEPGAAPRGTEPGDAEPGEAEPGEAVRAYYRALDARRFGVAWRFLSSAVRAGFGGPATWRAGFATTRSSRPGALTVTAAGDHAVVRHVLTAVDATACGDGVRRFALSWTLARGPDGAWHASAVAGQALSGALPDCPG